MTQKYVNPLEDKRVMLSLEIDDIKEKCKELGIRQKDINFNEVFRLARKNIENSLMNEYWDCLEYAIQDSKK
jgi:hypothetical protein